MADQCDSDCGIVSTTVSLSNYENGSEATCDDGIDNDCDGTIDCDDHPDCDSDPACGGCVITCTTDPGCLITPGANMSIVSGNCCGAGNCYDCDNGYVWDGTNCVLTATCVDNDGDGHYAIDPINCPSGDDCNDDPTNGGAYCYPGNPTGETCDTHDNDCNGLTDEGCDDDGDGYCDSTMQLYNNNSMCPNTIFTGNGMFGDDCDDGNINIHPGATEICDGLDNDCNSGTTDGAGESAPLNSNQTGVCAGSRQVCSNGSWIDDYSGVGDYETAEITCDDGLDNDCDGAVDCDDTPDCDSALNCSGGGSCVLPFVFPCVF
jgi:hypothetical protein